jgi:xanthine/CO dehydrogenase XdhC/CoxF family maturation factor
MTEEPLFKSGWEVTGIRDGEKFFRSLHDLLPTPAYLVLEGTSIARDVQRLYQSAAIPPRRHVAVGTIFPRPTTVHVPASASFLAELADLAAKHAEPEICDHLHAYDDGRGLLQWYDAFDLPLLVDGSIEQDSVRRMCDALGATYKRWQAG